MMKRWIVCTISVATYCMLILFCICYQMYVVHGKNGPDSECDAGQRLVSSNCVDCIPGTYMGENGHTNIACVDCATGYYQDQSKQASCKDCETGQYQDQTRKSICKDCVTGEYQDQTLTRKLINYIHDDLKISTKHLINSDGTDDDAISHKDFLNLMENTLKVPFTHNELLQIIHLLDPHHTEEITVHSLVSFYRSKWDKIILSSSIIMFILYPTTARNVFKLLACRQNLTPVKDVMYLINDLDMQCYDQQHMVFLICVGLPSLVLYVLGFPLVSIFAMFGSSSGKKMEQKWDDKALYRYSMFLNGYRVEKFYWECIISIRKSAVTFIGVFFSSLGVQIQAYIGLVFIFSFLVSHIASKPFEDATLNRLETYALAVAFLTLYLGLMFWTGWLKTNEDKIFLSVSIITMNVVFCIWAFRIIFSKTIDDYVKDSREAKAMKGRKVKVSPTKDKKNEGKTIIIQKNKKEEDNKDDNASSINT